MKKLSVTEFAYKYSISRPTVLARTKDGVLEYETIGNRKIIYDYEYNRCDLLKRQDIQKLQNEIH